MARVLTQPELQNFPALEWPDIAPRISHPARVALERGLHPIGVEDGYRGLLEDRFRPIDLRALDERSARSSHPVLIRLFSRPPAAQNKRASA